MDAVSVKSCSVLAVQADGSEITTIEESGPQAGDYPTGAWADGESRDYHVCVQVAAAAIGQERLAARGSLAAGAEGFSQGLVRASGAGDEAVSARVNSDGAH